MMKNDFKSSGVVILNSALTATERWDDVKVSRAAWICVVAVCELELTCWDVAEVATAAHGENWFYYPYMLSVSG